MEDRVSNVFPLMPYTFYQNYMLNKGFPDSSVGKESIYLQCRRPRFDS